MTPHTTGPRWTLIVTSLAVFMLLLDLTVVNVALPDIRDQFSADFAELQWVLDAYALGLAAVLVAAGSIADRLGRRRIFAIGLIVFTLASLACGLAPNIETLIVSRLIQGIGGATLFAVGPALLGNAFHGDERTRAFGIFGGVGGLAIAFGPLIGGGLTDGLSWHWIFLVNVPIGIVCLLITTTRVSESRSDITPPLDLVGAGLFSGFLTLLVFGLLRGEAEGWTSTLILGIFAAALVVLVLFIAGQIRRKEDAMFETSLFRSRTFNGLNLLTLLVNVAVLSAIFLFVTYIQTVLGFSAWDSGIRVLPLTLTLFVGAIIAGILGTRIPPQVTTTVSMSAIAVGLLLIHLVDPGDTWTAALPMMFALGFGMGLFNPVRAELSISTVSPERAGIASGINETFQQVGVAVGIAGIGAFFHNRVRHNLPTPLVDAAEAVAAGGGNALGGVLPPDTPPALRAELMSAADSAFIESLHTAFTLAAVCAGLSAIIAALTIRRRDMYSHP